MFASRSLAAIVFVSLAQSFAAQSVCAQDTSAIEFGRQIRPILADNCFACHGPDENNREGGLRLDQKEGALAEAGSGGQPIVPGDVMAERNARFTQIFHRGWDQHFNVGGDLANQCRDIDQPCWALIQDLKTRGLLEDTLVVWGGEFGRTIYCQGNLTRENYGRDHHPRCFTVWMAGGGIKPGVVYGETDDFSYNIVRDPVHIHDMNATILPCLGIDHERLSFKVQGLDMRLTGVEERNPVAGIFSHTWARE